MAEFLYTIVGAMRRYTTPILPTFLGLSGLGLAVAYGFMFARGHGTAWLNGLLVILWAFNGVVWLWVAKEERLRESFRKELAELLALGEEQQEH
jgi:hypothetical protein